MVASQTATAVAARPAGEVATDPYVSLGCHRAGRSPVAAPDEDLETALRLALGAFGACGEPLAALAAVQSVTLRPAVEMGVRHDGRDAVTGLGLVPCGGLRYAWPTLGLTVSADAQGVAVHEQQSSLEHAVDRGSYVR